MPEDRPTPDALTRGELLQENGRLREELARVERAPRDLRRERDRLHRQRDRLEEPLDAARRAGYRQAAPFAKTRRQGTGRRSVARRSRCSGGSAAAGIVTEGIRARAAVRSRATN